MCVTLDWVIQRFTCVPCGEASYAHHTPTCRVMSNLEVGELEILSQITHVQNYDSDSNLGNRQIAFVYHSSLVQVG